MSLVKIPTSHFVNSAKRQYANIDTAMIREAVQNSVDAGAKNITFTSGPDWLSVTDDGCGMTEQVLVDAMLTMSGSHKSTSGAIGGFGAAKEILLFQHERYEIRTQDNIVSGSVLEYELTKGDYVNGTTITMYFHKSYDFDQDSFRAKAMDFLSKCDTTAEITYDGKKPARLPAVREVKDLGWGKLYCQDIEETVTLMTVRIKGVCMTQVYIGAVKKNIILEITKPSTEILTSNRDYFQYSYATEVQKLTEQITIDKASFGRLHNTITKFQGNKECFISRIIRNILTNNLKKDVPAFQAARTQVEELEKKVTNGEIEVEEAIETIKTIAKNVDDGWVIEKKVNDYINDVDFYVQINDVGYEKIPDEIAPGRKMKKKYLTMAKLWKVALKHVFASNKMDADFCIGWIVDGKAAAMYSRKNGREMYLLNPYKINTRIDKKDKKAVVHNILTTACHEVAHRHSQYHDETFILEMENLLINSLSKLSSYRELLVNAKSETI